MKLIRSLLFGNVVLLLANAINCDEQKVYHVRLVKNIADLSGMMLSRDFYDIDEKNLVDLYPMERLSDAEREVVCKDAVKKANEKTDNNITFRFVNDDEVNLTKAYLVEREDAQPFARPKVILASKCSTEPDLYVQIHDRRRKGIFALLVSIIFRENDVKSPITCAAKAMLYSEKLVYEISTVYSNQAEEAKRLEENTYNTDNFKEELRMAMCRTALDLDVFANRNMRFLMGANTTDVKRLYSLGINPDDPNADEVAQAFRCPTLPPIYLEVREVAEDETFWVFVIVNRSELPPNFRDLKFTYKLKTVLSISETSTPVPSQRLPFYHIFKMFFLSGMWSEIDPNRFVQRQRSRMCKKAFQVIDRGEGAHLEYLEGEIAGKCEFFRINLESGRSDEVQAFKCPTDPPIYLSVGERGPHQSMWVYLEESEPTDIFPKLGIVGFKMKIVTDIIDVPVSKIPELVQTVDVQKSVIDPDALSRAKRKQLCEKAVQAVSIMKIKYFPEVASEMSRYFKLETEYVERQTVESNILQAYKCATSPEILLHITEREGGGNILWIIMRESETLPTMNFTGYQVKTFKEITLVEPGNISRELSKIRTEVSTIRIEGLGEERRLQMCHTALKIASKPNIKFLKNTRTGDKRFYAVSTEADDGETSVTIVPAFRCPTEPPLYLHIKDDKDKFTVWIMMEEVARALVVDELRYDSVVSSSDIIEVPPSELKKESRSSLRRSVIDLDNKLTEGERVHMCLAALKHIPGVYVFNFLDDQETGKKKYYAIDMDSRGTRSRSAALRPIFVEAFQCPTRPPIFLHVDEDADAFVVWVIHSTPSPLNIDDLEYKVKIATAIEEISQTELTKLPSKSIEKMVVDTNALSERERQEVCRNALDTLQDMDVQFSNNVHAGKKKYYVVVVDSGLAEYPSARVVVQAFKCPCVPPIYVHINKQERGDAYEAWVFLKPIPNLNSMSYRFKVVDFIDLVSSAELTSNRAESREDTVSLDTNDFPKEYRYKLCENAVAKISQGYATMSGNQDAGPSQHYYYRLVGPHEQNTGENRRRRALAFKCPSVPNIFIEVRKLRDKYIAWVFVKDVDLKEEGEENCYLVQYAKSITRVDLSGTQAAAVSSTEVNTDAIRVDKRFRMCRKAIRQPDLSKMSIDFVGNSTEDGQYRKHFYAIELMSGERYNVQAFDCPTEPPVYLQIHCWKSKCHIVSVLVEQKEPAARSTKDSQESLKVSKVPKTLKELRDSENESVWSMKSSGDSDEELIQVRTARRSDRGLRRRARESRRSRQSRESSASSKNLIDLSPVDDRRSRGSAGSNNREADSDSEVSDQQVKLSRSSKEVSAQDEEVHQSRATDSDASSGTAADIPLPTNVKHIDSIKLATKEQISMMPSARREKLMIDTDKEYTSKQRERMCRAAAQHVQQVDKVEFLRGVQSGPSQFYIIHERPLVNRNGKQKIVRAFECPTDPSLYLKVRRRVVGGAHREYEEVIMTVLVKNRSFVTFDLKLANRITKTAATTAERSNEYDSDDERASSARRLQLCMRAFGIAKKVLKGPHEFSNISGVPDVRSYILDLPTGGSERLRAFPCPCTPAVYLQVQPQIGYTKVSIIVLASNESPFLEYPEDQSHEARASRVDAKKIRYKRRLVSAIKEDDSPVFDDDDDDDDEEEEEFVPDERDAICSEAIALFPKGEIALQEGYPEKSRKYILTVEFDRREAVKAFPCATIPPVYVQVQGNAVSGYTASVIMEVRKRPTPSVSRPAATPESVVTDGKKIPPSVSSRPSALHESITIDDIRYTLVPVVDILDANDMIRWLDVSQLPQAPPVSFTHEQREKICDNSLQVLGPARDFIVQFEKRARDDYSYYFFRAQYTVAPNPIERLINAFVCKTDPKIYIEIAYDADTKVAVANVIIEMKYVNPPK